MVQTIGGMDLKISKIEELWTYHMSRTCDTSVVWQLCKIILGAVTCGYRIHVYIFSKINKRIVAKTTLGVVFHKIVPNETH